MLFYAEKSILTSKNRVSLFCYVSNQHKHKKSSEAIEFQHRNKTGYETRQFLCHMFGPVVLLFVDLVCAPNTCKKF